MAFTVGDPKKKRGFLLAIDDGEPPDKSAKGDEYATEKETDDDGGGDFEAAAKAAGIEDLDAFMKFLPEALKRCK